MSIRLDTIVHRESPGSERGRALTIIVVMLCGVTLAGESGNTTELPRVEDQPRPSIAAASVWDGHTILSERSSPASIIAPHWQSSECAAIGPDRAGQGRADQNTRASAGDVRLAQRESVSTNADRTAERPVDDHGPDKNKQVDKKSECCTTVPDAEVGEVPFDPNLFSPSPSYQELPFDTADGENLYAGKYLNPTERPWVELGRGLYLPGRLPVSQSFLGEHNLVAQHLLVHGDFRTATAYIDNGNNDKLVLANRLNLDFDWKLTGTERIHGFWGPLDRGNQVTRFEFDQGEVDFIDQFDKNWDTVFFEGDLGSILSGFQGKESRFDLPFATGLVPLLFQNGVWMEDALVGGAFTFPARHSAILNWSNYDITFFTGVDQLNSPAFGTDDSAANVYGVISFIEAYQGYLEAGYAYLDDRRGLGRSYHNMSASFTRRYWHRVSNSLRVIVNAGQDPIAGPRTADGCLLLFENALITSQPNTFVPYCNCFAGFGRPQSVARAVGAGGILRNTGIVFETDGLTGFPLLDDTGSNSYGGAIGVNWLGPEFNYQWIVELGTVQTFGNQAGRKTVDDQYGIGTRFQLPLTQAWLLRLDAIYGILDSADDLSGVRAELRYKF